MDRVHRIGQKKAVKVVRLIVKNIVEGEGPEAPGEEEAADQRRVEEERRHQGGQGDAP